MFHYNKSILEYFATLTPAQAIEGIIFGGFESLARSYDFNANPQDGFN